MNETLRCTLLSITDTGSWLRRSLAGRRTSLYPRDLFLLAAGALAHSLAQTGPGANDRHLDSGFLDGGSGVVRRGTKIRGSDPAPGVHNFRRSRVVYPPRDPPPPTRTSNRIASGAPPRAGPHATTGPDEPARRLPHNNTTQPPRHQSQPGPPPDTAPTQSLRNNFERDFRPAIPSCSSIFSTLETNRPRRGFPVPLE